MGSQYLYANQNLGNPLSWNADKQGYFAAIQTGMTGDYAPMRKLVEQALTA